MRSIDPHSPRADTADLLRKAMLALAVLGVLATTVELATLRHWKTTDQVIPWVVLGVVAAAVLALIVHPTPPTIKAVRTLAVLGIASGLYGLFVHVKSNYDVAILDYRYTDTWPTMSLWSKLWAAATGGVGPSPVMAPAVLSQCAICLAFATLHHPRLRQVSLVADHAQHEEPTPARTQLRAVPGRD
ncbi:MAG: hypothetical protein Q7V88_17695 [Actinomycetota bacterium]|nr:hypothetical protein [Actinomycetota bacterium]